MTGTPARNAGANFSNNPQHGKLNGDAVQWRQDMLAHERAAFGKPLHVAFDTELRIGQIAASARGISRQRADSALDVDGVVAFIGAGISRQPVQHLLVRAEMGGERRSSSAR